MLTTQRENDDYLLSPDFCTDSLLTCADRLPTGQCHPVTDLSPAWSPDGSRLAFVSNRDGNDEIYTMNADGSDVRRLTETPDASESFPAWSPDGAWLVFSSGNNQQAEIYLISADGSQMQPLTANGAQNWTPAWRPAPTITTTAAPTALPALLVDSGRKFRSQRTFSIAVGDLDHDSDLDGDGDLDALTCEGLWLNNGAGVFSDSGLKFRLAGCYNVLLGDVDGDGDLDVIFESDKSDNALWLNTTR